MGACRFIASVKPCPGEKEARDFVARVKEEYADATHNAYAYRLGTGDGAVARTSDAGEPAGTAGPPLLAAIDKVGVTGLALVGTRYFGGVKLGIGGLIRAYRACGEAGLREAGVVKKINLGSYLAQVPYDYLGQALKEISSCRGKVERVDYGEEVLVRFTLPPRQLDPLRQKLKDATRGNCRISGA